MLGGSAVSVYRFMLFRSAVAKMLFSRHTAYHSEDGHPDFRTFGTDLDRHCGSLIPDMYLKVAST